MSLDTLKSVEGVEDEKDILGGSQYQVDSGLYDLEIEAAFITKSEKDAMALNLHLKGDGILLRFTEWMTSNRDKGCKTTYTDKKGNTHYLPGYVMANSVALLSAAKEISACNTEDKVINLYNSEQKKEVPTKVEMVTDLLGKSATFGIIKQIVNKQVKGDDNKYHPVADTREENVISKVFRQRDGKTTAEIRAGEEASFINKWRERNEGKTIDRSKKDLKPASTGAPAASNAASTTESLFD